jgi:hypothetical protein
VTKDELLCWTDELWGSWSLSKSSVLARLVAGSHVHSIRVCVGRRGINRAGKTSLVLLMLLLLLLLLRDNLPGIELY